MYRIGICDDEICTCSNIEDCLEKYAKNKNIRIDVEVFFSGEGLCKYLINKEPFDLLFLDIVLDKMDGVEAGYRIREQMEDNTTQIIFISSNENYALQLFKIRPFDFLVKPVSYEHIAKVMDTYIKLFDTKKFFFEYKIGKKIYRIDAKEIIYFRSNAKKIEMVTKNGTYEFYEKLNRVQNQLDDTKFWRIHQSYIVNCDYVSTYKVDEILLAPGNEMIPVSQAYRESMKEKIMQIQAVKRRQ